MSVNGWHYDMSIVTQPPTDSISSSSFYVNKANTESLLPQMYHERVFSIRHEMKSCDCH